MYASQHIVTTLESCASAHRAGASLHQHLSQLMPPLLTLGSRVPRNAAAADALRSIVLSVQEDGAYLLIAELTKARLCVQAINLLRACPLSCSHIKMSQGC